MPLWVVLQKSMTRYEHHNFLLASAVVINSMLQIYQRLFKGMLPDQACERRAARSTVIQRRERYVFTWRAQLVGNLGDIAILKTTGFSRINMLARAIQIETLMPGALANNTMRLVRIQ